MATSLSLSILTISIDYVTEKVLGGDRRRSQALLRLRRNGAQSISIYYIYSINICLGNRRGGGGDRRRRTSQGIPQDQMEKGQRIIRIFHTLILM